MRGEACILWQVYHGEKLDQELGLATRAFLEDDLEVDLLHSCVTCTKILDWYGADFGSSSREIVSRLVSLILTLALILTLTQILTRM